MLANDLFVRAVKVETYNGPQKATNASGFFFLHNDFLYLITNRHVVCDPANNHRPDAIRLQLHVNPDDLTQNQEIAIPLYSEGKPAWKEHPQLGEKVDVVAIPVNDPLVLTSHYMAAFTNDEIPAAHETLPPGQHVLIIGFPLGFHDTVHNLPLARQATVASDFAHPFKGEPYFVTDARMHRGTSGSPVVALLPRPTAIVGQFEDKWCLLGVHSAALDVSDRDHNLDDRLGLNVTWYARLLPEIVAVAEPVVTPDGAAPSNVPVAAAPPAPAPAPEAPPAPGTVPPTPAKPAAIPTPRNAVAG